MKPRISILVLLAALAVPACGGDSAEERAQASVCDARASIAEEVEELKDLSIATATTSEIRDSLTAIRNDLGTIEDAQADLGDERRSELREANEAFEREVSGLVSSIGTSTSLSDAKTELAQALEQLAATYQDALATFDCE